MSHPLLSVSVNGYTVIDKLQLVVVTSWVHEEGNRVTSLTVVVGVFVGRFR